MPSRPSRIHLGVACIVASIVALAAVGCGNPTKPAAAIQIAYDTLTAYSLNTALPFQPTAFYLATNSLVVPDGNATFDIALNIEHGNLVVYPPKLILSVTATQNVVGLQIMQQSFNSITIASRNGYEFNDSLLVNVGQVFEVVSQNTQACSPVSITSQELLYAKFVVDSINVPLGQIHLRAVVDPNCDYDTLIPSVIPTH